MYCDVSVPGPLEEPFTYRLPETMEHRVAPGCRVLAPFGLPTWANKADWAAIWRLLQN